MKILLMQGALGSAIQRQGLQGRPRCRLNLQGRESTQAGRFDRQQLSGTPPSWRLTLIQCSPKKHPDVPQQAPPCSHYLLVLNFAAGNIIQSKQAMMVQDTALLKVGRKLQEADVERQVPKNDMS